MAPRILILGVGLLQINHVRRVRGLGCVVIGLDRNPQTPARDHVDILRIGNPTDTDEVVKVAREEKADAILSLTEFGVVPAARASEALGLRQIPVEAALAACDKKAMREAWARAGIAQPRFASVTSLEGAKEAAAEIGFPLMLKARSLTAAQGVQCVDAPADFEAEYRKVAGVAGSSILVEQCISGIETSVEGIAVNGRPVVLAYGDKELRAHRWNRVTRSINYPGRFSAAQVAAIRDCTTRCVRALGLDNSPFHFEVFVTDDKVIPIECAARGGGGHIASMLVEQVSGTNLVDATVKLLLGERPAIAEPETPRGGCYRFLFPPHGKLERIEGLDAAHADPRVMDAVIVAKPGSVLSEPGSGIERAGFLATAGRDRDDAYAAADAFERTVQWVVS